MKNGFLLLLAVFFTFQALSQTVIRGTVKDSKGVAVKNAALTLQDTYDGGITDSTGKFSFKTFEKGEFFVVASGISYKNQLLKVVLDKDTVTLNFTLKDDITELDAVTVTAGSFEANDKKRATVLNPLDIVTVAGANGDITSALQTLPGTQRVGEETGLFVRGGTAEESKIIIDGTVVNNFFFSAVPGIQSRGRFSPFLFNSTAFSSGGYSALYGQALSAVLNLESVDVPDRTEVQAGISPIFASAGFQKVAKNKKSSFGINYTYSNLWLYMKVVPQGPDFYQAPESHNIDANFRIKTKKNGIVKIYAYLNNSDVGLRRESLDSVGLLNQYRLKNTNFFVNVSWRQPLGKGWKLMTATSFSTNLDNINGEVQNAAHERIPLTGINVLDGGTFAIESSQDMAQFRSVLEKKIKGLNAIRFGGEVWRNFDKNQYDLYFNSFPTSILENYSAAFVESDIFISKQLAFRPGLRFEYSDLTKRANIAPRASVSYLIAKPTQVSFDYGVFYQTPERKYLIMNQDFNYTRADHYILTFQHFTKEYTFRAQTFYKDYKNLLKTDSLNQFALNTDGYGYARGIELFWRDRKTIKGVDYWISYSFLDTKRDYLNFPILAQPTFAASHNGSIVIKKFWVKKMFGINYSWNWATGRPYFNPNRPDSEYLSDRTPFYNTSNLSFNWLTSIARSNAVVVLGINNVFHQKQIFNYSYSSRLTNSDGTYEKQVLGPPAAMSFFVGLFMSWGVDRTQETINNNL